MNLKNSKKGFTIFLVSVIIISFLILGFFGGFGSMIICCPIIWAMWTKYDPNANGNKKIKPERKGNYKLVSHRKIKKRGMFGIPYTVIKREVRWVDWETYKKAKYRPIRAWEERFFD